MKLPNLSFKAAAHISNRASLARRMKASNKTLEVDETLSDPLDMRMETGQKNLQMVTKINDLLSWISKSGRKDIRNII